MAEASAPAMQKKAMTDWNEKYRNREHLKDAPLPLLMRIAEILVPGDALDIACGPGRNTLFLAEHGWHVTAVDSSPVAIQHLRDRAGERAFNVEAHVADLEREEFEIAPAGYDLICNCYYLQRSLFPQIRAGVRPGGIVVAAIHMVDPTPGLKSMNPDYLLRSGELRDIFAGWTIIHDYEGKPAEAGHQRRVAELVARRC